MKPNFFRTRIKFCGMTRAGDVRLASELGVDAVGFAFVRHSPRRVQPEEARAMRNALAPLVDAIALFEDNPQEEVREIVRHVRPSLLQFQGNEDEGFCRSFGVPYLKMIATNGGEVPSDRSYRSRYPTAAGFLFEAKAGDAQGGQAGTFDWSRIPDQVGKPWLLTGALTPANVHDAVIANRPWGVDVAEGVELSAGIKDGDRMREFVEQVRLADCHLL